jgi:hypothetical protein
MNNEFKDFTAQLREYFARFVVHPFGCRTPTPESTGALNGKHQTTVISSPGSGDERLFNSLALELFALQFKHNAAYRRFCEARDATPERITNWNQIPAVPTSAFKELELSCLSPAERSTVFHSSGTTGHRPSRHYHSAESLAIYEASLWTEFPLRKKEGGKGEQLLILTPPPDQAPHSSLAYMFEVLRRRSGSDETVFKGAVGESGEWMLDLKAAIESLRQAEKGEAPILILGTAFSYVHLLDDLTENGSKLELPPGSWAMETGGYKGRSRDLPKGELHTLITHRLAIPPSHVLCEYGMSELSSQAYDRRRVTVDGRWGPAHGRLFYFPPWARAQIVSPETGLEVSAGETGLIRVFDLANVFSVLAVQTEDLAIRRGDGFELLGRAAKSEPRGCSLQAAK